MFAFAGLRKCFRSFQINRNHGAGLGILRLKVAPAVGLDFVGPRCEARAIQLQRPGLASEPDIEFGGNRSVLRVCRSCREQRDGQNDVESGPHVKPRNGSVLFILRGRWPSPLKQESLAYRIEKHRREMRSVTRGQLCGMKWRERSSEWTDKRIWEVGFL